MNKEIKEKIKEMKREITIILDEEYGHQNICDRNPDRICSCPIGLVVDKLEDFDDQILSLFEEEKQKWAEKIKEIEGIDWCDIHKVSRYSIECRNCFIRDQVLSILKEKSN